jgi:hypothetical protein
MNAPEESTPQPGWRGFFRRCEPGARILLLLLSVVALLQLIVLIRLGVTPAVFTVFVLSLTAISTAPRWAQSLPPAYPQQPLYADWNRWRWVLLVAGAATLIAIWPRGVRMKQSLSEPEISEIRAGLPFGWKPQADNAAKWSDSVLTSVCNDRDGKGPWSRFQAGAGALVYGGSEEGAGKVKEEGLRLFPWVFGLATAGLMALLGAVIGKPVTGLAAGAILAVHPQHIQWSAEIGGNATMLLCFTGALLCMIFALQTNRWRWWLILATAQALCLLSNGGSFLTVMVMNLVAVVIIHRSPAALDVRRALALRLTAVFMLSVLSLATAWYAAGHANWHPDHGLPFQLSRVVSGMPAGESGSSALGISLAQIRADTPWRGVGIVWLLPAIAVAGLCFMARQDWRTRLVLVSAVAGVLLPGSGSLLFAVLLFPLALAWAGAGLTKLFRRQKRLLHAPVVMATLYVLTIIPALHGVMALPSQPIREAALAARTEPYHDRKTITATLPSTAGARIYDPQVSVIASVVDLDRLVDVAFDQDRPFFVYHQISETRPDDWSQIQYRLETSGRFKLIQEFAGIEASQGIRLYRYQPGEKIIHLDLTPKK